MCGDGVKAETQPEMEGIAEADLCADLGEVARRHRLDRAVGADRHEDRGLDDAVVQGQRAAAGGAVGGNQFKMHGLMWRLCNSCFLERCEIV